MTAYAKRPLTGKNGPEVAGIALGRLSVQIVWSAPAIARSGYLNRGTNEEVMVPRRYPVEFRRKVLDLIEAGKPVVEIAAQLGVSDQTIYNWRNQDRIDRGLRSGVTTAESAELSAARKRIRELETELAVTKRANELLKQQTDPTGVGRSSPRS